MRLWPLAMLQTLEGAQRLCGDGARRTTPGGQGRRIVLCIIVVALLTRVSASTEKVAQFTLPSGVSVRITEAPFEASKFQIKGCSEDGAYCRINGRIPAGVVFGLPETYMKEILITFKGKSHSLDSSDMYDAWGGRPLERPGVVRYFGGRCYDDGDCVFRGVFSDAAGAFAAEWSIVDGVSVRNVLTDSSDVVRLFLKQIDPPEFTD